MLLSRARLRLRGLKFREKTAESIPPEDLRRIDISRDVSVGISVVDVIQGMSFQTRSLLLALKAGEPFRIALALAWEAVLLSCQGWPVRQRTSQLIAGAEKLAERIESPHALGMARLAAGAAGYLEGRYPAALKYSDEAAEILRNRCTGVMWELDTAQIFGMWTLIYLGRFGELRERFLDAYKAARERGDRYMEATVGVNIGVLARLAHDEVEIAREQSKDAIGRWSHKGFHVQHLTHLYGDLHIDHYQGDSVAAWKRISDHLPALHASLLLRIQQVRIDILHHGGKAAAAAAMVASDPAPLLREAEQYARKLDRERLPWSDALAMQVRAGISMARRDPDLAAKRLRQAASKFDEVHMGLLAACMRRRLGTLLKGDEGRDLVSRADAWMAAQSIRFPAKMTACWAPGFPD